jgi:hypothetical protein
MSLVCETTRILAAFLEPDGSITAILLFPDGPQPLSVTIDPIETTIQVAGPSPRPIDLTYGVEADRHLRLIVAMHVDALAYERELERSGHAPRRGPAYEVDMNIRTDHLPVPDDWAEAAKLAADMDAAAAAGAAHEPDAAPIAC